jgi:RHS repeat-associated protein
MLADREITNTNGKNGVLTEYLFVDAMPVAVNRPTGASYIEADHLGTPRVSASPATNAKEWGWDLLGKAFGENPATTLMSGKDVSLRYPGQWRDGETELLYNYFRDYETTSGRYVESDPIGLRGGVITYAYAKQNPLRYSDAAGLKPSEAYCRAHPLNCGVAYYCGGEALVFAGGGQNNVADALRHCYWSCCMASYIGRSAAKDVGDDTENIPGNPAQSRDMDYCNNDLERRCGNSVSSRIGCMGCCAASPLQRAP